MNKQFKELELKAYVEREMEFIDPSNNMPVRYTGKEFSREQFYKLIVEECTTVLNKRYMGDQNREDMEVRRCIADLNKHFGIE